MNVVFFIGWQHLLSRKRQTLLSVFGVVMGVAFFLAISSMMQGMHTYFIHTLIDTAPHVKVLDEYRIPKTQAVYDQYKDYEVELRGIKPRDEIKGIRSASSIIEYLNNTPNLSYSPVLSSQVFIRYGGKDKAVNLIGIIPEMERNASNLERDMTKRDLNSLLLNSNGIIIGEELALKLSIKLDSTISVISPAGIIRRMKVVGLFNTGVPDLDKSTSYAILKKVQTLQNRENRINQINIRLKDINQAGKIAADIENRFGYRTESWQETFANVFEMFMIENFIMYSTVGAIILVAGFGIYNIISTSVNDKRKDIAILKSIGFSQKDIQLIFIFQGFVIGLIGTTIGCLFGAALIEIFASISIDLGSEIELPVNIKGLPMYRSVWLYVTAIAFATLISTLSAYFPAKKAAELYPVDIIRGAA